MNIRKPWLLALAAGSVLAWGSGCGDKKEKAAEQAAEASESGSVVTIKYALQPSEDQPFPTGLKTIAVEQVRTNVEGDDASQVRKWEGIATNVLMTTLQKQARTEKRDLDFVETGARTRSKAETDLAAAGQTDGDATEGKMKGVQAQLAASVSIIITKTETKGRTLNAVSAFAYGGWGGGGGGGGASSEETTGIRRDITISSTFKLIDLKTTKTLNSYTNTVTSGAVKKPGFIGGGKGEGDLSSADAEIKNLIESAITEFVGQLMGGVYKFDVPVLPCKSQEGKAGVTKLLAEDYAGALSDFQAAIAKDSTDAFAMYNAGVACEASGKYKQAVRFYLQAKGAAGGGTLFKEAAERVKRLQPYVKEAD